MCHLGTSHGRSSDLQASYLPQLPSPFQTSAFVRDVRSCLPLRGSSGISPDSLLNPISQSDTVKNDYIKGFFIGQPQYMVVLMQIIHIAFSPKLAPYCRFVPRKSPPRESTLFTALTINKNSNTFPLT